MSEGPAELRDAFRRIYSEREWGQGSGPGSSPANTIEYRAFIQRFIEANAVRTVTDLGCGDWQFSRFIDWSQVDYLGLDIVPEVVAQNRERFALPHIRFDVLEAIDELPGGDLLLAKEVLQHLPNETIAAYLTAIRQRYRFALMTNAIEPASLVNQQIAPGGFRPIRLQNPPFNAAGAVVFAYFPHTPNYIWKNGVFPLCGA